MDAVIEKLLLSPKLKLYWSELTAILETEEKKRERFYREMRESQKVEFINGEMVVQTPVKIEHTIVGGFLFQLLNTYVRVHNLGFVGYEKNLIVLTRNDYEPDICFFAKKKAKSFKPGQMKFPAPDFVVEIISPSTEEIDRTIKFEDYAAHGVEEYWIIDPDKKIVEQYLLKNSGYFLKIKADSGKISSTAIDRFTISISAIFEETENLTTLRQILASQ